MDIIIIFGMEKIIIIGNKNDKNNVNSNNYVNNFCIIYNVNYIRNEFCSLSLLTI